MERVLERGLESFVEAEEDMRVLRAVWAKFSLQSAGTRPVESPHPAATFGGCSMHWCWGVDG